MAKVKCALYHDCKNENDAANMFYCPRCEAWYCEKHAPRNWWSGKRYCPKDHEIPKGQG